MAVIKVTADNFESVKDSNKTLLLDFYADWCGPCRLVSPVIDEIADEATDFAVGKINVDNDPSLAQKFGVMSIPTLIVLKDGALAAQAVGVRSKEQILAMVK